jgi:hypothetical protein
VTLRIALVACALGLVGTACGSGLGVGQPECETEVRDPSVANLLALQAVPTARYTPCLKGLPLGWDGVQFFARNGESGFSITRSDSAFLTASVAPDCDTSGAAPVPGPQPDIEQFVDIEFEPVAIGVTLIPEGTAPLVAARSLAAALAGVELDDRPIAFRVDENIGTPIESRIEAALTDADFAWLLGELDTAEGTVEFRSVHGTLADRRVTVGDALERVEDLAPGVYYRGNWYFRFQGGCITYEFDATGRVAETVADDTALALGFYPAYQLARLASDEGFDLRVDSDDR